MEKVVKKGFVCFFDIMGYKNILLKNDITECAKIIKDILFQIPEDVKNDLLSWGEQRDRTDEIENVYSKP